MLVLFMLTLTLQRALAASDIDAAVVKVDNQIDKVLIKMNVNVDHVEEIEVGTQRVCSKCQGRLVRWLLLLLAVWICFATKTFVL